jgi:hypothetical protein
MGAVTVRTVGVKDSDSTYEQGVSASVRTKLYNNNVTNIGASEKCTVTKSRPIFGDISLDGHKAELRFRLVEVESGDIVSESGWRDVCVPLSETMAYEWETPPLDAGNYTIVVQTQDQIGSGHQDSDAVQIEVNSQGQGGDGSTPGPGPDPNPIPNPDPPQDDNGQGPNLLGWAVNNPGQAAVAGVTGLVVVRTATDTLLSGE